MVVILYLNCLAFTGICFLCNAILTFSLGPTKNKFSALNIDVEIIIGCDRERCQIIDNVCIVYDINDAYICAII